MPGRRFATFVLILIGFVGFVVIPGCGDPVQPTRVDPPNFSPTGSSAPEPVKAHTESEPSAHSEKPKHTNRLAEETSPYLLLHAHNPVDWYPWGEDAFAKAKRENKLIFLSVGYSSCFWCHVMERESFMDEEIANYLNEHFVCIKVDREERPDVDAIYMTAVQIMSRRGGWPMTVFMTPSGKPLFGGTYFPARDNDRSPGMAGFLTIIQRIHEAWETKREDIMRSADVVSERVALIMKGTEPLDPVELNQELLDSVQNGLSEIFDEEFGGFGFSADQPRRPKFPEPSRLLFLVDRVRRTKDESARKMLLGTLDKMAWGGIRDHLGGGFHRYSTDRFWHIPHFEKMLYDNGQLTSVYAEAYQLTGREEYRQVVVEMLTFVLREMTDELGGFFAALDAETDAEEGKFYRWELDEMKSAMSADQWERFAPVYSVDGAPNFEHEYFVPMLTYSIRTMAEKENKSIAELERDLSPLRTKLLELRSKRERPLTDTKVLASWNGLMIRGFADAGRCLKDPNYIATAERAAEFILAKLLTSDGRLLRTYSGGETKLNAYLDDYAFVVDGLIALHRATENEKWLTAAGGITEKQIELFWDEEGSGFFFTSNDHESLIARAKDFIDGVEPAGNSVSADNLVYLSKALDKPEYLDLAEQTIQAAGTVLSQGPSASPRLAIAISVLLDTRPKEVAE